MTYGAHWNKSRKYKKHISATSSALRILEFQAECVLLWTARVN